MKRFRRSILKTILSLALIIAITAGMLPNMAERANAATVCQVNFDANGGTNPNTGRAKWCGYYSYNSSLTVTSNTFVKPGYELAGFYVGNTYYAYGKAVRIRSNITVKASWKACSHPQKQVVSTAATCTRDGKTQVICSKCKQVFSTSTIKGGHKWQITHFGGPNGHDVYCTVCGTTSVQPHTFKYCSRDGRGTHYVECTQCTYFGTQKCRDCIPDSEWEYLVYRGFESGKNLCLRNGFLGTFCKVFVGIL